VATALADPATAEQQASPDAPGTQPEPFGAPAPPPSAQPGCANCGSPLHAGQDWCLNCGAGAPGSLGANTPSWRSGASVLIATALLVLGAAAAAYAALNQPKGHATPVTTTAQSPVGAAPGAVTPAPTATAPSVGTPTTVKPGTPLGTVKPPKIPLTTVPLKVPTTSTPASTTPTTKTTPAGAGGSTPGGEPQTPALAVDTNAAATYNPYNYPATNFGDPSLAIDGETSTGWTAQVDPAVAPKMAEGLVIDLKSAHKLSAVALITATPGMMVQLYGTNAHTLPPSILDPAWVKLSTAQVVKARHARIKIRSTKAVRFLTLWISRAPAASVGTAQAPGHVSVNELELFP
jgi:hypothetical protein